ncbi:DUF484 family protein [Entomomonas sp. E2T0]|uniref:DUF484 family protein n=1 Tax=Entomomonas sp. E2T0 TaxID=2930213 RepID=UPI002228314B|nr:DUF484 family protein [Entomomonas sp. E2T0]UYZ84461.1 DUF484 family protein [Entomomonas sp. E2T0]
MSQPTPSEQTSNELTAEAVAEYIRQHPDFFIKHDDVLQTIRIRHESGKAISLIEHQLNRLRSRNQELQKQLNQLLEMARENDRLFEKARRLTLELLEAASLESLVATLEDSLRHDFKIEKVSFILFSESTLPAGRFCKLEEAQTKLGSLINTDKITTGQFRDNALEFLFGSDHNVHSAALVPLRNNNTLGLLALGSSDQYRYQRETGTIFLQQISDILCRILPRLL